MRSPPPDRSGARGCDRPFAHRRPIRIQDAESRTAVCRAGVPLEPSCVGKGHSRAASDYAAGRSSGPLFFCLPDVFLASSRLLLVKGIEGAASAATGHPSPSRVGNDGNVRATVCVFRDDPRRGRSGWREGSLPLLRRRAARASTGCSASTRDFESCRSGKRCASWRFGRNGLGVGCPHDRWRPPARRGLASAMVGRTRVSARRRDRGARRLTRRVAIRFHTGRKLVGRRGRHPSARSLVEPRCRPASVAGVRAERTSASTAQPGATGAGRVDDRQPALGHRISRCGRRCGGRGIDPLHARRAARAIRCDALNGSA